MTRHLSCLLLAALLLAGDCPSLAAQPAASPVVTVASEGATQELRLRDGTTHVGRVTAVDGTHITFLTRGGATLTLEATDVVALTTVRGRDVDGVFWKDDPNPTRLFFGPTARPIDRGSVHLGVYEVVMPFVQVGLTDRISVGGGTPLVFGGGSQRPFWFTPKVAVVNRTRTQASLGVMHIANLDGDSLGVAYGVVTQGTRDSAITVGLGMAYARLEDSSPPILMVGGEHRVHRHVKLVSENYVFDGGGLASAGVRFMSGRLSADLALVSPIGVDEVVVFPMVNFVWAFR